MNAIGKIGKLIVEYQYEIEIALLALLVLIVLVWIIRLIARAVRRRDVLTEISSRVEDINATVNDINRRQEALISEMPAEPERPAVSEKPQLSEQPECCVQPESSERPEASAQSHLPEQPGASEKPQLSEQPESPAQSEFSARIGAPGWYGSSEHPEILMHPEIFGRPVRHEMPGLSETWEFRRAGGFVYDYTDDATTEPGGSLRDEEKARDICGAEVTASDAMPELGAERSCSPAYSSVLKYCSRDCATDKFGNVYSEEVLNEQIH